jgi:hypothetical protein
MQALSDYFVQTKIAALVIRLLRLERGRRARPPRQPQRFRRWINSIYDSLKGAQTGTLRCPYRPWRVHPRSPAAAGPGSLHLTQLGHRGSGQVQPHRLPLTTSFKESII